MKAVAFLLTFIAPLVAAQTTAPAAAPVHPICYVCGGKDIVVTNLTAIVTLPDQPPMTCQVIEMGGLTGQIKAEYCPFMISFLGDCKCASKSSPVSPTLPPVKPTVAPGTKPTTAVVEPTQAPVAPTKTPVAPSKAPVVPTKAPLKPTEAPVEQTKAPAKPTTAAPAKPTFAPVAGTGTQAPAKSPTAPTKQPVAPAKPVAVTTPIAPSTVKPAKKGKKAKGAQKPV